MSKPREFWFAVSGSIYEDEYFETFISTKNPKELNEKDDNMGLANLECVHVIEKSAYDALAAENEKLKNAISDGGFEFALARTSLDIQRDIDLSYLRAANAELAAEVKKLHDKLIDMHKHALKIEDRDFERLVENKQLHAENAELIQALRKIADSRDMQLDEPIARDALAKHGGEK